nr:hypothetical protein [Tanacetum cinerariifolium]
MLRACVIDFGSSWDHHFPLEEFHITIIITQVLRLHHMKYCTDENVNHPYAGVRLGIANSTSPEFIRDMNEKFVQIKNRLLTVRSRQKSYVDKRAKPLEFEIGDMVLIKVSPWKGAVPYTLELPEELKGIHNKFHVLNLKKFLAKGDIVVPVDEIQLDDKLHMIEKLVEVVDREVKRLMQSQIPVVKVRWNSQRGPEFTWEREGHIKKKYPHIFTRKDEARKRIKLIPESYVNSSELLEKQDNRSDKGYHEVPPPLIGNYMPPKRDLRLIDEHFETESVDVSTVSSSDVKTVDHKGVFSTEEPKHVRKNSFGPPIIEDWHLDDDSEDELSPTVEVKTVKPSVENIKSIKTARETVKTEESPKQHKHHPRGN